MFRVPNTENFNSTLPKFYDPSYNILEQDSDIDLYSMMNLKKGEFAARNTGDYMWVSDDQSLDNIMKVFSYKRTFLSRSNERDKPSRFLYTDEYETSYPLFLETLPGIFTLEDPSGRKSAVHIYEKPIEPQNSSTIFAIDNGLNVVSVEEIIGGDYGFERKNMSETFNIVNKLKQNKLSEIIMSLFNDGYENNRHPNSIYL